MHLIPIGTIHSSFLQATGTPIQPARAGSAEGTVELLDHYVEGLQDLSGFDRVWLLYWFDRACPAKLKVVPYRDTVPHGIFATRVPPRPNPIGMSCVRLLSITGNILRISGVDILDGTPLLDIKPYVPAYDNYAVERCGWLDGLPDHPVLGDARFEGRRAPRPTDFSSIVPEVELI